MAFGKIFMGLGLCVITLTGTGSIKANSTEKSHQKNAEIRILAVDIKDKQVEISNRQNKILALLFFKSTVTKHKTLLAYAQVVYNKFKDKGLSIFGITEKKESIGENLESTISFPLIVDSSKKITKTFNVGDCCGGTVIFNRNGKIKFNTPALVSPETFRQLIELEVLGKITYDVPAPLKRNLFVKDKKAPGIKLEEVYSKKVTNFSSIREKNLIVTFLSSVCGVCRTGSRVKNLVKLREILQKHQKEVKVILVFFKPFDEKDIEEWESHIEMPFEKYISANIYSDEENYITDESLKSNPFTIVINDAGKVLFSERRGMSETQLFEEITKLIE